MHVHLQHKRAFQIQEEEFGLGLLITIPFCENFLRLLVIMTELTEFECGIIIGAWLFDHSEREIEAKTAMPKAQYMTQ